MSQGNIPSTLLNGMCGAILSKRQGSNGKDPRIAALERARELGRAEFLNGWEIRVKTSDELNGYLVAGGGTSYKSHSIYCQIVLWYCYYKNSEFMFAICGGDYITNIIADYYINSTDGTIYNGYDRIAVITDDVTFTVENNQMKFNLVFDETSHYYNSDGSIDSQSERTYSNTWRQSTMPLSGAVYQRSNLAILRSDHQTYINDVLDFCGLQL